MHPDTLSTRTIIFVNIAHAVDHFVLLIFPTAVIALAAERGVDYATLIGLTTGAFVAFGLCSLPMGWLSARFGRRNLLAVFFGGCGVACLGLSTAGSNASFAVWLTILGVFSAIYHPIGTAMLVNHGRALGRDLARNGVFGNLGVASASGVTALIATWLGWRAAFAAPGIVCVLLCAAFLALVPGDGDARGARTGAASRGSANPAVLFGAFAVALIAGGLTFNMVTIAMPKVIDERLGEALPLALVGWLATAVFIVGAATQIVMGRLIDRYALPSIFVVLSVLQPVGLGLAAAVGGPGLMLGLALAVAAIYGQVIVNDAMVARYVPPALRDKAYGVRYFLGFTTAGFAAPLIAWLHGAGGFPAVLLVAAVFGAAIFASAVGVFLLMRTPAAAPAE